MLERRGVEHHVLNAKNHEKEAQIVAQAGRIGSVTVATNMAGRGVDILLGGNSEYLARQEMAANGFDNDAYLLFDMPEEDRGDVRGRLRSRPGAGSRTRPTASTTRWSTWAGSTSWAPSATSRGGSTTSCAAAPGRQGDPGESLFYLSLEDDLMRMFASDRVASIMERLKWPDGEPIEAKMVSRAVENAQKQIEELNYERRKNVLKYDEVMNGQREVIYAERRKILEGQDLKEECQDFVAQVVEDVVGRVVPLRRLPRGLGPRGVVRGARRGLPGRGLAPRTSRRSRTPQQLKERFTGGRDRRLRPEGGRGRPPR